jgi:protocatechuate 3,4-dioxygenase beta subunit
MESYKRSLLFLLLLAGTLFSQEIQLRDSLENIIAKQGLDSTIVELEKRLQTDSPDEISLGLLHLILAIPHEINRSEAIRLREIIKQKSIKSTTSLIPPDEPGERLNIIGVIRNAEGQAVGGARVLVFQTDASGCYSPSDMTTGRMDEPNSRLFGMMVTGKDGHYEFLTVRPGGYPFPRRDVAESHPLRYIPAHIHFEIAAAGYASRQFQMVFDDDPRMNPEWRVWAENENNPVVKLTRDSAGTLHGVLDIVLHKE